MFTEKMSYVTLHDMDTGLGDKKWFQTKVSEENIHQNRYLQDIFQFL